MFCPESGVEKGWDWARCEDEVCTNIVLSGWQIFGSSGSMEELELELNVFGLSSKSYLLSWQLVVHHIVTRDL